MYEKIYFEIEIRLSLLDIKKIFSMKQSEFEIFHSVESYDKKLPKIVEI